MNDKNYLIFLIIGISLLWGIGLPAHSVEETVPAKNDPVVDNSNLEKSPHEIPVGVFVTSIYDMNFPQEKYSVTFWVWATYQPKVLEKLAGSKKDYVFFDHIEIINAQEKKTDPTEQYIINNADGSQYATAKFTAKINQNWDVHYFPFDKQTLKIMIESVEVESSVIKFVPDIKNSLISNDFNLSGWHIAPIQLEVRDYQYPSTFGTQSKAKGTYSRLMVKIPIKREGTRIFLTAFIGFFVSYIVVIVLIALDKEMLSNKLSLIMTASFATIGNKNIIDAYFPSQTHFSLSDLIQIATFTIVAMGLINTVTVIKLVKMEKEELANKLNYWMFMVVTPTYPIIVLAGVYFALTAT